MSLFDSPTKILDSLSAPVGQLIASVGRGVAEAQREMDRQTIDNFKLIYGEGAGAIRELRELGYQPTWYHIPETTATLTVAVSITEPEEPTVSTGMTGSSITSGSPGRLSTTGSSVTSGSRGWSSTAAPNFAAMYATQGVSIQAAPVDASYAGKFNYEVGAASTIVFKIVSIPPPAPTEGLRVVPNVVGKTVAEAEDLARELGITLAYADPAEPPNSDEIISAQDPAPGEIIGGGRALTITM